MAIFMAHAYHLPLELSPDHIWTLIMQGLGEHLRLNEGKLK